MNTTVRIVVDGAPTAKGRPRLGVSRAGRAVAFTPSKTRSYEGVVRLAASEAMRGRDPFDVPLTVRVNAVLPIPGSWSKKKQEAARVGTLYPASRPDVDNFAKAALDACNTVVFRDDSLVCDLHVAKRYGTKPALMIEVTPCAASLTAMESAA